MTELHTRTVVRALTYRIFALLITSLWTGLTALHYIHERIWLKIKWGKM